MYKIDLISFTQVDWATLISIAGEANKNHISSVDNLVFKTNQMQKFLMFLSSACGDVSPSQKLQIGEDALAHFSFSFAVQTDCRDFPEFFLRYINIITLPANDSKIHICSGSLDQWKIAIVRACRRSVTKEIREIANNIMLLLENAGLSNLWSAFNKTGGSSFYLEPK